jgi:hypothetical protein
MGNSYYKTCTGILFLHRAKAPWHFYEEKKYESGSMQNKRGASVRRLLFLIIECPLKDRTIHGRYEWDRSI